MGDIGPRHVLLAWGHASGNNTIGRTSRSHGNAIVKIGGQQITVSDRNYTVINDLTPDTEYEYEISLRGNKIGHAKIRTWPEKSEKLRFFVIGDYGSGDELQARVAEALWKELERNLGDNPVRFILTTGDNIYGQLGFTLRFRDSGDEDNDWAEKFFAPYERVIARIPFYPSLGNHDGNETEARADLTQYLDNFFFPGGSPARYYRFSYGGLADFFALDTSQGAEQGPPKPLYVPNSDQHKWLTKNLSESQVPWKIPYFHHPPFNGGPRHPAMGRELGHFMDAFKKTGVKVVFTGHEHNFQFTHKNGQTGDVRYVVTGAGGELRTSSIQGAMQAAQIEGWAAQLHFLLVEIEGKEMRIFPKSFEEVNVTDRSGKRIAMPLKVLIP